MLTLDSKSFQRRQNFSEEAIPTLLRTPHALLDWFAVQFTNILSEGIETIDNQCNEAKRNNLPFFSVNDRILFSLTCQFLKTFKLRRVEVLFAQPALGKWRQLGGKRVGASALLSSATKVLDRDTDRQTD